ncbi:hypothetical protein HN51_037771 [Arachis hypogaea]|uniref:Transmembrane protein n=2 Tax=Arachis TaxID=3817 RepID=A0A444ZUG9_ARAHY|nr:uncharacterized protein LOC107481196 [Arachis duranensis]XP_025690807.1 uncharacterized protein LOC112791962 isoform X2 [Arachis hypogaea]QHO03381.1 uncharacterized protein DS421_13g431740 [Arachis hypogaea]RYR17853.1 hypothetical protein Ahy_B03g062524 [Arachis hypogaea]
MDNRDSEDINEWQEIEPGLRWGMVTVNDDYLQVPVDQSSSTDDPPIHHQQASSSETVSTAASEDDNGASSPSSVEGDTAVTAEAPAPSDWRIRVANEGRKLLKLRLEAARNGVVRVASMVRECVVCVGTFWSVTCVFGVAAAVLVAVVSVGFRRRRWRRVDRRQSVEELADLLREKDEKIGQLLIQIAQLNEALSSRRKVPVLRISS